jgi:hypothetical protein
VLYVCATTAEKGVHGWMDHSQSCMRSSIADVTWYSVSRYGLGSFPVLTVVIVPLIWKRSGYGVVVG